MDSDKIRLILKGAWADVSYPEGSRLENVAVAANCAGVGLLSVCEDRHKGAAWRGLIAAIVETAPEANFRDPEAFVQMFEEGIRRATKARVNQMIAERIVKNGGR